MQMKKAALLPRKSPSQARSVATVDVILEAASQVLGKSALAGYNTTAVAEQAGVSIGSIYQYFSNRDALTAELILRVHRDMVDRLRQSLEQTKGMSLEQALQAIVQVGIPANPKLARVLEFEEERLPRGPALISLEGTIDSLVMEFIQRYSAFQIPTQVLEIAAIDVVSIIRGMTDTALSRGGDLDDLTSRIIRALVGYLAPFLPSSGVIERTTRAPAGGPSIVRPEVGVRGKKGRDLLAQSAAKRRRTNSAGI